MRRFLAVALFAVACNSADRNPDSASCLESACPASQVCNAMTAQCEAVRFTLTATADPGGSVTVDGSGCTGASCVVAPQASVTLTALAEAGQLFTGWSGGPGCSGQVANPLVVTVSQSLDCTAGFVAALGVGGSVTGRTGQVTASSLGATCDSGECAVAPGATVTLVRPPDDPRGRWVGWFGDPGCSGTDAELVLTSVTAAVHCEARYQPRVRSAATVIGPEASVTVSSNDPLASCEAGSCWVDPGSDVELIAPSPDGWLFAGWGGACVDFEEGSGTLSEVSTDTTCTATFDAGLHVNGVAGNPLAIVSAGAENGSCDGATCVVRPGDAAYFTVERTEWTLVDVTGTGCEARVGEGGPYAEIAAAAFEGQTCTLQVTPYVSIYLETQAFGSGNTVDFTASGGLSCVVGSSSASCDGLPGQSVTIHAIPASGAVRFDHWADLFGEGRCPVAGSQNASASFVTMRGAYSCEAIFVAVDP